jgi:hypothetical protein
VYAMRNFRTILVLAFIIHGVSPFAFAGDSSTAGPFAFDADFDWIGLGGRIAYKGLNLSPYADTVVSFTLGGAYDTYGYFRTPLDLPYDGTLRGYDSAKAPAVSRWSVRSGLELVQGLLWNERDQHNKLEVFLAFKSRYEKNVEDSATRQLLFDSDLPDRDQLLQNSVFIGLEWRDINRRNHHRVLSGCGAETSMEWGPEGLFNSQIGRADFARLNISTRAFLPLFDLDPGSSMNSLSAYMGFFLSLDYATGSSIPLNVRETFGGRSPRKGLGYSVRGLEDCRFDTPFKAVANWETRLNLHAIADPALIPGLLYFVDCGYYNFVRIPDSGFVFSTGGGIFLSLFDVFNLTFTTQFLLNETRVTGGSWAPFFFTFIFHF